LEKGRLEQRLIEYCEDSYVPFHMPGHKRQLEFSPLSEIARYDITEIDTFDNYHAPTDIIKQEFDRAAEFYESDKSIYLVNGSSCGLISAICGAFNRGDEVLMARNCHKSVYNGIYLNGLKPHYIYPRFISKWMIYSQIDAKQIEYALDKNPNIKGVILTSPTYEGIVSNIKEIADLLHKRGCILIVDEAHGAHFGYEGFPSSSIKNGADIVIQSLHKTLPSLTQTAIIHLKSKLVDYDRVLRYVSMYQSTSPSYLLMASISSCIETMRVKGEALMMDYSKRLDVVRKRLGVLKHLTLYSPKMEDGFDYDKAKLVIGTFNAGISGNKLHDILLYDYKIQVEMASLNYVILMTSLADTWQMYEYLIDALIKIDNTLNFKENLFANVEDFEANSVLVPAVAMNMATTKVKLNAANGKLSSEYVYVYPPGIPILVPGEVVKEEAIEAIKRYRMAGLEVIGLDDKEDDLYMEVLLDG